LIYDKQFVQSKLEVFIKTVDDYETLNTRLLGVIDKLKETKKSYTSNVKAWHTHFGLHLETKEFDTLINVCLDFIYEVNEKEFSLSRKSLEYECVNLWAMDYERGEYTLPHIHYPANWSFVYYVDVIPDQSPVVFEDVKIYPKNGDLIMFHGMVEHGVPPTINARTAVSMNFMHKESAKFMNPDP
tara:strand:- start:79 stop:633 length:555 start_codon:yes stop_codon:yes gene_type:complete